MFGVGVTETHLGHHEGLVGGISKAIQGAQVPPILFTDDLQLQPALAAVQEWLQGVGDRECMPVTFLDLQHLLYHQGTVRCWLPTDSRKEDPSREAGVSVRVSRGVGVDPQRGLENLDTLAMFLQKLESKTEAACITTLCLIYGSM